jgi:hypothetical protein
MLRFQQGEELDSARVLQRRPSIPADLAASNAGLKRPAAPGPSVQKTRQNAPPFRDRSWCFRPILGLNRLLTMPRASCKRERVQSAEYLNGKCAQIHSDVRYRGGHHRRDPGRRPKQPEAPLSERGCYECKRFSDSGWSISCPEVVSGFTGPRGKYGLRSSFLGHVPPHSIC